jgi:transposase InsO family protein
VEAGVRNTLSTLNPTPQPGSRTQPRSTASPAAAAGVVNRPGFGRGLFHYLEIWHNRQRRHSRLGMLSPIQLETQGASGLLPSMGSVRDCYDNSLIESFWSRVQIELLDRQRWTTRILANALWRGR